MYRRFSFINNFSTFQILLDTSQLVDCTEECNVPGLCDDYVVGCTDQSAENFNELTLMMEAVSMETTTEDCNNHLIVGGEECENLARVNLRMWILFEQTRLLHPNEFHWQIHV